MRSKISLLCVVFVATSFSSSLSFALDPMGPPAATLKQGQPSIGVEYSYSEMDIEADNIKLGNSLAICS